MVDVDPENVIDTQIFSNRVTLQAGGAIAAGMPSVLHSRGLSFTRNATVRGSRVAGTQFQTVIRTGDWTTTGTLPATASDLVAAGRAGGVLLRFSIYLAASTKTEAELATDFAAGLTTPNPSIGTVIGTLAPWWGLDLTSVPAGRRLNPSSPLTAPAAAVAPAYASFDSARSELHLNLLHTVPEKDATGDKVNVGPLTLRVRTVAGPVDIGPVPYDKTAYQRTAGLVTVPVSDAVAALLLDGPLELVITGSNTAILTEEEWAFETDDRGVYMVEGGFAKLRVRTTFRGRAPAAGTLVHLTEYSREQGAGGLFPPAPTSDRLLTLPATVPLDTDGWANVNIAAIKPGIARVGFAAVAGAGSLDGTNGFYANLRIFPADDYSMLPDSQVTFAKVYDEVLRFYHLLYPAMTEVFSLADEAAMAANARSILERISATKASDAGYMPRTREMSAGKRALLARWCRKILGLAGSGITPSVPSVPLPQAIEQMRKLIAFLKAAPHNAAGRHTNVDLPSGGTLADNFADPDALLAYLQSGSGINNEAGLPLIVPRNPDASALYRLVRGGVGSMTTKFNLTVPDVGKTGVVILGEWINALK